MATKKQADAAKTAPTTAPQVPREPLAEPPGGWPPDEYTGKGGRYVRDPYTGIRRPVDAAE